MNKERLKGLVNIDDLHHFDNSCFSFEGEDLESMEYPDNSGITITPDKLEMINMMKKEHLSEVLFRKPKYNTAFHLISNGTYDFFTFIPVLINFIGYSDEFYGSTWTLNRNNCVEMFRLYDSGLIKNIHMFTGTYFKRRESAVYATLLQGIQERNQHYKCFENHAKIVLLCNYKSGDYFVVEGSANFTANPRTEQYVITNNKDLFLFHKNWMDKILHG